MRRSKWATEIFSTVSRRAQQNHQGCEWGSVIKGSSIYQSIIIFNDITLSKSKDELSVTPELLQIRIWGQMRPNLKPFQSRRIETSAKGKMIINQSQETTELSKRWQGREKINTNKGNCNISWGMPVKSLNQS